MGGKLSQRNGQRLAGGKPIPQSQFALPGQRYPVDTPGRARNALSRVAQHGTDSEKARVRAAVKRRFSRIRVSSHASDARNVIDLAQMKCPSCGYQSDDADFSVSGGTADTSSPSSPSQLRTPQRAPSGGSGTVPLRVRGASSGNLGLANNGQTSINLARRLPVRQLTDIMVTRQPDGSAVIRHRQGGGEIGKMKPNGDGTWTPVVDGKSLSPHMRQQAAIGELVGTYNRAATGQPLQTRPQQTPLMQQYGVPAIGLASDGPDDNSDSDDDDNTSDSGLTPRGQQIYKKLTGKGIAPKVALAMAKRSQNGPPGRKAS